MRETMRETGCAALINSMYERELAEISAECVKEGYPSNGSNYELRVAGLWEEYYEDWYEEAQSYAHEMIRYQVEFTDPDTGAKSPVDVAEALLGYTAEDYIRDCERNADPDWVELLRKGTVEIFPITE